MFEKYIAYVKDNPKGLWFKQKRFGWGWTPVTWHGWLVVAVGIAILFAGVYVGEKDDAPGAALLGFLLMIALIIFFGYRKGGKPKWNWGWPKK